MCHSELSEALEDHRNGEDPDAISFSGASLKPVGIPIELADVLIRIFDMCGYYGIDLEEAVKIKMGYNQSRSYRHGNKVL